MKALKKAADGPGFSAIFAISSSIAMGTEYC
jgi:hypothetical protein